MFTEVRENQIVKIQDIEIQEKNISCTQTASKPEMELINLKPHKS